MNLQYPTLSEEERAGLDDAKKQLKRELEVKIKVEVETEVKENR
ncbi:hypothetical protein [Cloacibacterium normanense]